MNISPIWIPLTYSFTSLDVPVGGHHLLLSEALGAAHQVSAENLEDIKESCFFLSNSDVCWFINLYKPDKHIHSLFVSISTINPALKPSVWM